MGLFVREIVGDAAYSSFVMNLSPGGALLERPVDAGPPASDRVQLEIRLQNSAGEVDPDTVWGLAEVVHDECVQACEPVSELEPNATMDSSLSADRFRRTALRFTAMASAHRERLDQWLAQQPGGERWEDLGHGVRVMRPG